MSTINRLGSWLRSVSLGVSALVALGASASAQSRPEAAGSSTLSVSVSLVGSRTAGEVGCALFAGGKGFPLDASLATTIWQPAQSALTCRFEGLAAGDYAVAVSHDLNGNRRTDRNLVGIPKEAWGVSNNVRPRLRAPRFDEALVRLTAGAATELTVEVRR